MGYRQRYRGDSQQRHSWVAVAGMGLLIVVLYVAVQRGWFQALGSRFLTHMHQDIMQGVAEKQKARAEAAAAADKNK